MFLVRVLYLSFNDPNFQIEANKIDGLTIFDIEDDEMITLLSINNSIHRKRLRKGEP